MKNRSHLKSIGRKTDNRKKAVTFLLAMALCLWGAGGGTSLAAVADESQGTVIIEYNNLRELLKQGNLSLKESIEDYEDNINAYQEIWDTLKREQDNMEDKAEDMDGEDSQTAGIYSSNAAMLKSSASRIYRQLDSMTSEKSTRSLEKSADTFTMTAQILMNSYNQMVQNVEYQEKRVESLQAAFEAMVRKQAAGSATQAQMKEAKKSLDTAGNSLDSLRLQAGELRRQLLTMLGIEDSSQVVIGAIPEPDMAAIEAVDYESDKNRAMGNDRNVQNARHTSASSTTEINIRFRLVEEAEGTKEAAFLASYQNLQASKTAYEAALTAFESARLTYEGLQRKQQAGLLTSTQYLEGQAAYLEKKAAKETASMNLAAAYESYCWEGKGISQT
ncbi:MAG: TolC family protein [Clostridia bacterium]|nr:TolC family protein [Clostridia bacterium]